MSRAVSLGAQIGRAHVEGKGMASVYASDSETHVTVKLDRGGREYWMPRTRVQWRPWKKHETKEQAA